MLIKIAWRNVWRNKKRSLIILGAVSLGLWTGIFILAFYNGMIEQRVNSAISSEVSHLQLHHPKFRDDYDPKYILPEGKQMLQEISRQPSVKAASGRVILKGMIASASGSSGININGVMPAEEAVLTGLQKKLVQGNYLSVEKPHEMMASERLLKKLKLKAGKKAILTFQDKDGNIVSGAFRVTGIFKTNNTPYDEGNLFVNISAVDSLAGIRGKLSEIAVLLNSNKDLEKMHAFLQKKYPGTQVLDWRQISPEVGLTVQFGDQLVYIFMGIILLALAFGILNTMMMAVLERTRELGMLLALGMNRLRVFLMIFYETCYLVLAGCPPGIFLGIATTAITHRTGINFSRYSDVYAEFGYSEILYPELAMRQFIIIIGMVVATAILSGLLPARRALLLNPAASIRK